MQTRRRAGEPDEIAPDGSEIRFLASTPTASMAEFRLSAGQTTAAVVHRTVDEVWFVTGGRGELWRNPASGDDTIIELASGVSVSIECGTAFQFRTTGDTSLTIVGVTVPPWPGDSEALPAIGPW